MSDATTGLPLPDPIRPPHLVDAGEIDSRLLPVPVRIGAWVELVDGALVGHLRVHPTLTRHGVLEPTALVTMIDMLGGLSADDDVEHWVFTSNMSLRMPPVPAPEALRCTVRTLRAGARSSTSEILINDAGGAPLGMGFVSFSRVPRRPTDLPKPEFDLEIVGEAWSRIEPLDEPPRDAAGMRVVDAATGHLELDLADKVNNPAGALHGAMIGMLLAAAAETLADTTVGGAHVAGDLDIRYLNQARSGPVATRARFVGDPELGSVVVDLVDHGRDDVLVAVATVRTYRVGD